MLLRGLLLWCFGDFGMQQGNSASLNDVATAVQPSFAQQCQTMNHLLAVYSKTVNYNATMDKALAAARSRRPEALYPSLADVMDTKRRVLVWQGDAGVADHQTGLMTAFMVAIAAQRILLVIWPELQMSGALDTRSISPFVDEPAVMFDACPWREVLCFHLPFQQWLQYRNDTRIKHMVQASMSEHNAVFIREAHGGLHKLLQPHPHPIISPLAQQLDWRWKSNMPIAFGCMLRFLFQLSARTKGMLASIHSVLQHSSSPGQLLIMVQIRAADTYIQKQNAQHENGVEPSIKLAQITGIMGGSIVPFFECAMRIEDHHFGTKPAHARHAVWYTLSMHYALGIGIHA
jgi:hypothetical protein